MSFICFYFHSKYAKVISVEMRTFTVTSMRVVVKAQCSKSRRVIHSPTFASAAPCSLLTGSHISNTSANAGPCTFEY